MTLVEEQLAIFVERYRGCQSTKHVVIRSKVTVLRLVTELTVAWTHLYDGSCFTSLDTVWPRFSRSVYLRFRAIQYTRTRSEDLLLAGSTDQQSAKPSTTAPMPRCVYMYAPELQEARHAALLVLDMLCVLLAAAGLLATARPGLGMRVVVLAMGLGV